MQQDWKQYTIRRMYNLNETIAHDLFDGKTYPWEVLPEIGKFVIQLGRGLSKDRYVEVRENIWIAKTATVAPTACIEAPTIIDEEATIRHGAYIRGNVLVGKGAVVGNSTELKNVILFNMVQVPHYNYVGDSVLGFRSHMGAGSITSNVKGDKSLVVVKNGKHCIPTGFKKFGAMLADEVEVGCNSVLNPGTVIGNGAQIYPLSSVRGCVAEGVIYKNCNEIIKK